MWNHPRILCAPCGLRASARNRLVVSVETFSDENLEDYKSIYSKYANFMRRQ